jgi:hypothetical protein
MQSFVNKDACPRCGFHRLKSWDELTDDERFVAERTINASELTPDQRKKSLICTRCWYEGGTEGPVIA